MKKMRIRRAKKTIPPTTSGDVEEDSSGFRDGVGEGSDEDEGEGAGTGAGAGAGAGPQLPGILLRNRTCKYMSIH